MEYYSNNISKYTIIGKHSYISSNIIHIYWALPENKIIIGNFCSISTNMSVMFSGNHRSDWVTTYPFGHRLTNIFNTFDGRGHPTSKGNIIIGNDVWIGKNVTIMGGTEIGDGAVIACNSHVVKNVEPYSIVGGNPAKFIKYRFNPEQIESLLKIKWWEWDDKKINTYVPLLCNSNIDNFIQAANTT